MICRSSIAFVFIGLALVPLAASAQAPVKPSCPVRNYVVLGKPLPIVMRLSNIPDCRIILLGQ